MRIANRLSLPRWLAAVLWLAQLCLFYLGAPAGLADSSARHGWHRGRPGAGNRLGLMLLLPGLLGIVWVACLHISRFPRKLEVPRAAPAYLICEGPYRFSRNPMYVAGIATWLGWAAYYGSAPVLAGALAFWSAIALVAVPLEERALESRSGDGYLGYKASASRWLGPRRGPGV